MSSQSYYHDDVPLINNSSPFVVFSCSIHFEVCHCDIGKNSYGVLISNLSNRSEQLVDSWLACKLCTFYDILVTNMLPGCSDSKRIMFCDAAKFFMKRWRLCPLANIRSIIFVTEELLIASIMALSTNTQCLFHNLSSAVRLFFKWSWPNILSSWVNILSFLNR